MKCKKLVERWKPVVGFEEHYSVSSFGRIKRTKAGQGTWAGRILKAAWTGSTSKYLGVRLSRSGRMFSRQIHVLVAEAFLPAAPGDVHHEDEDRSNNVVTNLRRLTRKEHQKRHLDTRRGERNGKSKLTDGAVRAIRMLFDRGVSIGCLAAQYGVWASTIRDVTNRTTWNHVI